MTKHDKATARPWKWIRHKDEKYIMIMSDTGIFSEDYNIADMAGYEEANAKLIVEAVNTYDHLKATNEKLVDGITRIASLVGDLRKPEIANELTQLLNEIEKGNNNEQR